MATVQHASIIRDEGYLILESVLSPDEIADIKNALSPFLQGTLMGRNNFEGESSERVYALLAKNPIFSIIIEHPVILAILDRLLEPDYLLSANLAINCHPGETPQPFHRDNDGGMHSDIAGIHGISTIWNLDDFTDDNGATEIIPRSHSKRDWLPVEKDAVKVLMPAGSVLIFTGTLYHRGGANNSGKARLAITPQYCQPWLRQLENMVLSVPPKRAQTLSSRVQALLGYSVRSPGFMGYVDGVHPKRLLDKNYRGRRARGEPTIGASLSDS